MNRLVFLVLLTVCETSNGQFIRRLVDSESNQPIPFASLKILNQARGAVSSLTGEFDLLIYPLDTLLITSVGYEDVKLVGNEIHQTISLVRKVKVLSPVIVGGRSTRITLPTRGETLSRDLQWGPSPSNSDEFAQQIVLDTSLSYKIRLIKIPIEKFSCWGPLMIRVYLEDSSGLPGEMIFSTQFDDFEKKDKAALIDLSNFNIYLEKVSGFFVAISWVPSQKNTRCVTTLVLSKQSPYKTFSRSLTNINYSWYPFGKFTDKNGNPYTALMFVSVEVDSF